MKNKFKIGQKVSISKKYIKWQCENIITCYQINDKFKEKDYAEVAYFLNAFVTNTPIEGTITGDNSEIWGKGKEFAYKVKLKHSEHFFDPKDLTQVKK